ncbi:MAG: outer membrane lipoprotein-sorting protein [Candidatus Hydrogenedentes bacterium]|jgi:outer membrane lipoprotein-sorting protein|nr:outer membrane lipoprotein-sorting protein [Candidatus Hydrogenedentota bacterium]
MKYAGVFFVVLFGIGLVSASFVFSEDSEPVLETPNFVKDGVLDLEGAIKYFENLYRSNSSVGEMEMTVVRPRRTQTMRMKAWTEGEDKSLIIVQAPPRDAGTATLKVDKNLWNYMPRIKRTVRIPPSMMLASWMGSDFTNDDLVRESSILDDYEYECVGPSESPEGWLLRCDAKPGVVGLWNRIDLIVSKDGTLPIEARYFDRKDRLSRTLYWSDVKVLGGRQLPAVMRLVPEGEPGNETTMHYLSISFGETLPADIFSLSRLEQSQ